MTNLSLVKRCQGGGMNILGTTEEYWAAIQQVDYAIIGYVAVIWWKKPRFMCFMSLMLSAMDDLVISLS